MTKIATIKTLVESLPVDKQSDPLNPKRHAFKTAIAKGKKLGFAVHTDGRCYIPEAQRGKGVGYGRHGHG